MRFNHIIAENRKKVKSILVLFPKSPFSIERSTARYENQAVLLILLCGFKLFEERGNVHDCDKVIAVLIGLVIQDSFDLFGCQ